MKHCLLPTLILLTLFSLSLANGNAVQQNMEECLQNLEFAQFSSAHNDWDGTIRAVEGAYSSWQTHQTYLHVFCHRDTLSNIDSLFRRCLILSRDEDTPEFHANTAELISQIQFLAETESFRIKHVL